MTLSTKGGVTYVYVSQLSDLSDITITNPTNGQTLIYQNGVWINGSEGVIWSDIIGLTQQMAIGNGYISDNAALVTLTLPVAASIGDYVSIVGKGAGGWTLAQNSGQTVHYSGQDTTTGVGGSIASTQQRDCLDLICTTANTDWTVRGSIGSPNVT